MKNEIDYWDRFRIEDRREGWPDRCQWCGEVDKEIGLEWRVVCDIKEDHEFARIVKLEKGKLLNFLILVQEEGESLPKTKEVEALIETDEFIFFVCSKSCAQKLYVALNEDRRFMDLAEKKRIAIEEEKKPIRSEFECELCGERFGRKLPGDIPKKGNIVKLTCPNCGYKGVKFIRTYEEYEDEQND